MSDDILQEADRNILSTTVDGFGPEMRSLRAEMRRVAILFNSGEQQQLQRDLSQSLSRGNYGKVRDLHISFGANKAFSTVEARRTSRRYQLLTPEVLDKIERAPNWRILAQEITNVMTQASSEGSKRGTDAQHAQNRQARKLTEELALSLRASDPSITMRDLIEKIQLRLSTEVGRHYSEDTVRAWITKGVPQRRGRPPKNTP